VHVLWLGTELLYPLDRKRRVRSLRLLRELGRRHRVTAFTLDDGSACPKALQQVSAACDELVRVPFHRAPTGSFEFFGEIAQNQLRSRLPYAVDRCRSTRMLRAVSYRLHRGGVDLVICDSLASSVNLPEELPCSTLLLQHRVEAPRWERRAAEAKTPLKQSYLQQQWLRMRQYENETCHRVSCVVTASETDREQLRSRYGVEAVSLDAGFPRICEEVANTGGLAFLDWGAAAATLPEETMAQGSDALGSVPW
jgi:hypothetical protein